MPEPCAPVRRQPLNSLATKIIFFVFLSTFLTALAVSWISIESTHRFLRKGIDRSFPAALDRGALRVQTWLDAGRSETTARAGDPGLRAALLRAGGLDPGDARRLLEAFGARAAGAAPGAVHGFVLVGPNGTLLVGSGLPPELAIALAARTDRSLWAARQPDGSPIVVATAPVLSPGHDGPPLAVLVGVLPSETLPRLLAADREDPASRVTLVGADGRRIASTDVSDAQEDCPLGAECGPDEVKWGPVPLPPPPTGDRVVSDYQIATGERVIGSARALPALGWTLMVEEPFDHAFEPVLSVVTRIFITDLCIILLFSFLAYKITAAIVHPIEALSEGARRVSQGELDVDVSDTRGNDEIGLLTRTFNDMTRKLRKNQAEIEAANTQLTNEKVQLETANEQLAQLSITDGLTKLHNHRFFQDHLTREIKRVQRTGEPLAMLLADIDDFKRLNDRLGHAAGDELLMRIARIMNETMRASDLLARYGGEEFVVLASGTELMGAVTLAEKVRESVAECSFLLDETMRLEKVTVSIGVAQYKGDRKKHFEAADQALYRAKAEGKNQVRISQG